MGNNVALPYSSYINGGLRDGMELVLHGTVKPNADRFSVNFCSGPSVDHGDVCFHFNPRFNQGKQGTVVRNHRHGNMWGLEETDRGFPLRRGQYFSLQVRVRNQGFQVLVNSAQFCNFTCRLSMATVQYLVIDGDVIVHSLNLKEERPAQSAHPWSSYIPGGVCEGLDVVITGTPLRHCDRFSFNFGVGPNQDQGDIVFHFNPRFSQGCVVRSHRQNGSWGMEETSGGMPFVKGQPFTVNLSVLNYAFRVLVNGRHFCDFNHRMAKELAQNFHVKGEVQISSLEFKRQPPPPAYPGIQQPAGAINYPHGGIPQPVYNPAIPAIVPIQGGFYPGKIIHLTGVPRLGGVRFHVELMCGQSPSSDLAFHFDVRFNFGTDRNVVVRAHRAGGQWGSEEKHTPYFPFVQNASFEMMMLCEHHCIKVAVNNQHFIEFQHRLQPLSRVDHLRVNGDVIVHQIRFQ